MQIAQAGKQVDVNLSGSKNTDPAPEKIQTERTHQKIEKRNKGQFPSLSQYERVLDQSFANKSLCRVSQNQRSHHSSEIRRKF